MLKIYKSKMAFTLVETAIVIVLLATISFFSIDFLLNGVAKTAVATVGSDIVQFFKKVQNQNKVFGVPGMSAENQTYYGIGFTRDSDNNSYYYSFRKSLSGTEVIETFHLPTYVYFSNLDLGETLELRFCADVNYKLAIDPSANTGGLEYLCDDDGLVCNEVFEIDINSKFADFDKKVFINTSKTQYECKPEAYIQQNVENPELCLQVFSCINNIVYNNSCAFEGEVTDYCSSFTPVDAQTGEACSCE
ncbi:MAG TPA: hypothetical protein P5052_02190 [Candidatus Paceibacterota bacterium]|jgi:hypothetical protein|nr:hypothetical protein [Candidatus Paceibacterota bacterium]HRZ29559.1 hypothetical protein [Candidatus Paceibacterota bacterium]